MDSDSNLNAKIGIYIQVGLASAHLEFWREKRTFGGASHYTSRSTSSLCQWFRQLEWTQFWGQYVVYWSNRRPDAPPLDQTKEVKQFIFTNRIRFKELIFERRIWGSNDVSTNSPPTNRCSTSHSTNLIHDHWQPFYEINNHLFFTQTLFHSTSAHDSATDFRHGNLRRLHTSTRYWPEYNLTFWNVCVDVTSGEGLGTLKISSTAGSPTCKWANHALSDLRPSFSFYLFLESEIPNLEGSGSNKQAPRTSARIAGGARVVRVIISYHINMQGLQLLQLSNSMASWGFPFKVALGPGTIRNGKLDSEFMRIRWEAWLHS